MSKRNGTPLAILGSRRLAHEKVSDNGFFRLGTFTKKKRQNGFVRSGRKKTKTSNKDHVVFKFRSSCVVRINDQRKACPLSLPSPFYAQ